MNVETRARLRGLVKLTVRRADESIVRETPWFDNLILNNGLNRFGTGVVATICQVGTSSTPPSVSQTGLLGLVASTSNLLANNDTAQASPPYYGSNIKTYRFNAGDAAGTLAEVGVGWDVTDDLWCRALILDADNLPTTITVLADEILDVSYELRIYPDLVDKIFSPVIGGITHDCILRASSVTDSAQWGRELLNGMNYKAWPIVFNGALGSILVAPSGTNSFGNPLAPVITPYVDGSHEIKYTEGFGLGEGNLAGGITAFLFPTAIGAYKVSFDPPIAKNNTQSLALSMKFAWARYNP
jgi:hypothetical protein